MDSQDSTRDPLQVIHRHTERHTPTSSGLGTWSQVFILLSTWLASIVCRSVSPELHQQPTRLCYCRSHDRASAPVQESRDFLWRVLLTVTHRIQVDLQTQVAAGDHVGVLQVPAEVHWGFLICLSFILLTFQSFHHHISKNKLSEMVFQVVQTVFHTSVFLSVHPYISLIWADSSAKFVWNFGVSPEDQQRSTFLKQQNQCLIRTEGLWM